MDDRAKVIHLLDNGWKAVFNPPDETLYTLSNLPAGLWSSAALERLTFDDACTIQRCIERLTQ